MLLETWLNYEKRVVIQAFVYVGPESEYRYDNVTIIVEISGCSPIRFFSNYNFVKLHFTADDAQTLRC